MVDRNHFGVGAILALHDRPRSRRTPSLLRPVRQRSCTNRAGSGAADVCWLRSGRHRSRYRAMGAAWSARLPATLLDRSRRLFHQTRSTHPAIRLPGNRGPQSLKPAADFRRHRHVRRHGRRHRTRRLLNRRRPRQHRKRPCSNNSVAISASHHNHACTTNPRQIQSVLLLNRHWHRSTPGTPRDCNCPSQVNHRKHPIHCTQPLAPLCPVPRATAQFFVRHPATQGGRARRLPPHGQPTQRFRA